MAWVWVLVLLLVQSRGQLSEKPDVLQNAVENARSLLGPVDVDDVGRLEMYLVDLVHWWSLILGPDLAVEHGGIGLVGNREGQPGMARGVFPVRSQTGQEHHHVLLSPSALWRGDLSTTSGRRSQRAIDGLWLCITIYRIYLQGRCPKIFSRT